MFGDDECSELSFLLAVGYVFYKTWKIATVSFFQPCILRMCVWWGRSEWRLLPSYMHLSLQGLP